MTDLELAWLAGFFDGEGCVHIDHIDRASRQSMRVQVSNTNPSALLPFQSRWGGRLRTSDNGENRKPIWVWACYAKDAVVCLQELLPYLRVKVDAAHIALEFQELKTGENDLRGEKLAHPRRSEILAARGACANRLRVLNRRGKDE